jgi:hypothetical protein
MRGWRVVSPQREQETRVFVAEAVVASVMGESKVEG